MYDTQDAEVPKEETGVRVLLVGVDTGEEPDFDRSMEELKSLTRAAGKIPAGIIVQRMTAVNKALYIGTGKVAEVKEYAAQCEAEEILFDNALSPSQIRNLVSELELPVLDRTNLILDIFAMRAKTRESRLQVETARLQYMLPRLVGMRENLSRQGGAGGSMSSKGAGETKLELDRRKIEHRISELKKELAAVARTRETMRKKRSQSEIPQVALVGYTNAGKSTILNRMVQSYGADAGKTVLEQDMLFATLETSVRRIQAEENKPFFLSDTVGFIHKLPHGLIQAFRSTLEEVCNADLLVQVVDFSDEYYREQMLVTAETLRELKASDIPQIIIYNKADKVNRVNLPERTGDQLFMAAADGIGMEELAAMIQEKVYADMEEASFLVPYDKGAEISYLMEHAAVGKVEYCEQGVRLTAQCRKRDAEKMKEYRQAD